MDRASYIETLVSSRVDFGHLIDERNRLAHQPVVVPKGTKLWRFGAVPGDRHAVTIDYSRRDRRVRVYEVFAWSDEDGEAFAAARWEGISGYLHWCRADAVVVRALTTPRGRRS